MALVPGLAKHRRTLIKFWLQWRLALATVVVVVGVVAGGFHGYQSFRVSDAEADLQQQVAEAQSVVTTIANGLRSLSAEFAALIDMESAASALAVADEAADSSYEQQLKGRDGRLLGVRLLPVGISEVDYSGMPPISYATLDLLRRMEASASVTHMEVHLRGDDNEHIAVIVAVQPAGHVLLAVDPGIIAGLTKTAQLPAGAYVDIQQAVPGVKALALGSAGDRSALQGEAALSAGVAGTNWRIRYWKPIGTAAASGEVQLPLGLMSAVGGALLMLVAGLLLFRKRHKVDVAPLEDTVGEAPSDLIGESLTEKLAALQATKDHPKTPSLEVAEVEIADEFDLAASFENSQAETLRIVTDTQVAPAADSVLPASIFRAYDIRGRVGETLTPDLVRSLGRAIGSEAYELGQQTVVVGYDGRLSSPELAESVIEGLRGTGRDVIDIGRVPTPMLYFATHYLETGSGVMVTGSHNPPAYNGLKIVLAGETLHGERILGLRNRIAAREFVTGEGTLQQMDIAADYIRRITDDIPVALGKAYRIVVDCGNGVAGEVAPKLLRGLGHDVIELYCDVDGRFPNHHPDPSDPNNLAALIGTVKEESADLGFAFDGDGDRMVAVDSKGFVLWPDRQMMLFARDVLSRNAGATIIYDVKCTSRLGRVITKLGGQPVMSRTGHSLIKAKMKETGAMLGGEMSGHVFFADRWYGFDDGMYAAARMIEILLAIGRSPAEVFAKLPGGVATPELRVDLDEGEQHVFMERLLQGDHFPAAEVTTIDGLRVDFVDGWGLVRASNTTPSLVMRFEGDTPEVLDRIKGEFRQALLEVDAGLPIPF